MSDILHEIQDQLALITLNRVAKHNAFDNQLLNELQVSINEAIANPNVRVIVLKANGKHFSAGADLAWMQRMVDFDEEKNLRDTMILGNLMYSIYRSPKPIIAMIQGSALGGGAVSLRHALLPSLLIRHAFVFQKLN